MKRTLRTAGFFALLMAAFARIAAADAATETQQAARVKIELWQDGVPQTGTQRQEELRAEYEETQQINTRVGEHVITHLDEQIRVDWRQQTSGSMKIDQGGGIKIEVEEGGVWAFVAALPTVLVEIFTHHEETRVGVIRTVLEVRVLDDHKTLVRLYDGVATVEGGGRQRLVPAGTQTLIRRGQKPQLPRASSPFDPSILLLSPGVGLGDPRLLDFIDPRIEPPKGGFP